MRNFCLKVHRYLALPFGLFMCIACFTGLLLVFRDDIASLLGTNAKEMPFFIAVKKLHRWLFMMPENPHGGLSLGRVIMGTSAMCASLILLTGVVVWWPKSKAMLKNRLKVTTNQGFRRFVYDTHVSLGIYVFIFLFLMALTGPVFSFGWYRQGISKLFGQKIEKKEVKKMDLEAIANGDYSSIAGIWQDDKGNKLVFNDKGLVSQELEGYGASLTDYGTASEGIYGGRDGGFLLEYIPAGVTIGDQVDDQGQVVFKDTSDASKNRLWYGVGIASFGEQGSIYYHVGDE